MALNKAAKLVIAALMLCGAQLASAVPVTVLFSNPGTSLSDLTSDGATLWVGGSDGIAHIYSGSVSGGGGPLSQLTTTGAPGAPAGAATPCCVVGLTRIGGTLYYIDPNGDPDATAIFSVSTGGGAVTKIYSGFATGQPIVDGSDIITNGTKLFTADHVQGRVHVMNADGSGITQVGPNRYGGFFSGEHFNSIAYGLDTLFVLDTATIPSVGSVAGIYTHSASSTTGGWTALATGSPAFEGARHIVFGDGTLFWTQGSSIWSMSASGGAITQLTSPEFHSLDGVEYYGGGTLYVTDNIVVGSTLSAGRVLRVDVQGQAPEPAILALLALGLAGLGVIRRRPLQTPVRRAP
jgi:hypothetical protein